MADAARANVNPGDDSSEKKIGLNSFLQLGGGNGGLMALGVVVVLGMFIVPLPTIILDAFMALNLIISLLVLLIVLFNKKSTDFSLFPTVLLVVTVFGLALNVSSTRAILTLGAAFDGQMIRAFSTFVVGTEGTGGLVIGFIIFISIIALQVLVITKGATRVSEVAARFSLDSLPGKQMAIDAEYSAGGIDQKEAQAKKDALQKESDFYGAMDGSSKFISGNVKFGIFIIVVNIIGGIIIGSTIHGEPIAGALATYTTLSIGDGLLNQLPALLVSTAMGIVVTRAAAPGNLAEQVGLQFSRDAKVYWIGAVVLFAMAWLPGFPMHVLLPMAGFFGFYAFHIGRKQKKQERFDEMMTKDAAKKPREEKTDIPQMEPPDHLSMELGLV